MDDDDLYLAVLPNIIGSGWDGSGSVCLDVFVVLSVCVCVCACDYEYMHIYMSTKYLGT